MSSPVDYSGLIRQEVVRPSWPFYLNLTLFLGLCAVATVATSTTPWVFLFVLAGWVLSLTLHEFGHAVVAYFSGDFTVASKGYLTLDVRKYSQLGNSIILPVILLLIGGIGLPGGAVWLNMSLIPTRWQRSLTVAAGPISDLLFALLCLLPIRFGLVSSDSNPVLAESLGFLGWLQVLIIVFNLLPLPGFDGFGILTPYLPKSLVSALMPFSRWAYLALFAVLVLQPSASVSLLRVADVISQFIAGDEILSLRRAGFRSFQIFRI